MIEGWNALYKYHDGAVARCLNGRLSAWKTEDALEACGVPEGGPEALGAIDFMGKVLIPATAPWIDAH